MASGDQDKTEAPTPKRKRDARKEGQIAKTPELGMWLQVLVASFATRLTLNSAFDGLRDIQVDVTRISEDPDPAEALTLFGQGLALAMTCVLPLALAMVAIGVIAMVTQTGLVLATKGIKPKFSKVNPLKGLQQKFKPQGLWQGGKSLLKVGILATFSWEPILDITQTLITSGDLSVISAASEVVDTSISLAQRIAGVGLLIAAADFSVQRWQTAKQMKMSKKDIKEEHKSQEGDAQVKGQIRRKQQEMSRNRMLAGVADASVVIVNPTHIAVAIRYTAGGGAPKVVAKGRGLIADRIREQAKEAFVPIVRDIPLARTLERSCKVDQTIPPDLFEAVARLLAFVMQIGKRASLMGGVLENPSAARVEMPADARV